MKIFYKKIFLFLLCFVFQGSALRAGGTTSGLILLKNPSSHASSMAESFSSIGADVGGISALHYNPAAPSYLNEAQLSFTGQRGWIDDYFTAVYFGVPTNWGTYTANILYSNLGDIELINTAGQSSFVKAQRDWVLQLNYAEKLSDFYGTGVSLKLIQSNLVGSITANAIAIDFGNQIRFLQDQLALGFSVHNIGSRLNYASTSEPLPFVVRGGVSYRYPIEIIRSLRFYTTEELLVALDFVKENDTELKKAIGLQYIWQNSVALRTGYKFGQDLGKLNLGLGILTKSCNIDYSISDGSGLGVTHLVTLTYEFPKEMFVKKTRKSEKKKIF